MLANMASFSFFFFNDTATTEIYTLSLHDALPISPSSRRRSSRRPWPCLREADPVVIRQGRSEEHTSELQSQSNLVCRLLLEKKKNTVQIQPSLSQHTSTARITAAQRSYPIANRSC